MDSCLNLSGTLRLILSFSVLHRTQFRFDLIASIHTYNVRAKLLWQYVFEGQQTVPEYKWEPRVKLLTHTSEMCVASPPKQTIKTRESSLGRILRHAARKYTFTEVHECYSNTCSPFREWCASVYFFVCLFLSTHQATLDAPNTHDMHKIWKRTSNMCTLLVCVVCGRLTATARTPQTKHKPVGVVVVVVAAGFRGIWKT